MFKCKEMKKILLGTCMLMISGAVFVSCSKKDTSGGVDNPPPPPPPAAGLTVSFDKSQINADGWEEATYTVKDQNNIDVTAACTITVDNSNYTAATFRTTNPGNYQFKATRSGVTSPATTLKAVDPGPSPFSQKILLEDYTGTWCGHCPRVGINLANYVSNGHPNAIIVANHGPSNDPYTFANHNLLGNSFNVTGYPTVWVDRSFEWNEENSQLNTEFTNRRAPLGLAFETSINGSNINVKTKVKFGVTTGVNLKLVVYLVEDGKVYPQTNYGYFGLPNPINDYVHDGILRNNSTDLFGDNIPAASQVNGSIYEKTFTINASSYDISKCRIVAFVVQGPNNQNRPERAVLNVQAVKAGQNKDFD